MLEEHSVFPENTKIRKPENGTGFEVLVASVGNDGDGSDRNVFPLCDRKGLVKIVRGDHASDLEKICNELEDCY